MKTKITVLAAALAASALLPLAASAQDSSVGATVSADASAAGQATKDTAITTKVKSKIAATKGLKTFDIHVETTNGVVTLSGTVDNSAQVSLAEKVAKGTKGVASVTNTLTAKASS